MRVAVTTPTGHVGGHVLAMLVRAGLRPLALARDPRRIDPRLRELVDVVVTDQADAAAVVAATTGVDALLWVNPPSFDAEDPVAAQTRYGEVAAQAVATNAISRTVFISSIGAELRHGVGEIDGLARTEQLLDDTGAPVTHLRCGYFFTNLLLALEDVGGGMLTGITPLDQPMPWVAPRDVAEIAVLRLLSPCPPRHHVQAVHGPEDLTWRQVATIISTSTGHRVDAQQVSDGAMRQRLRAAGLSETQTAAVMGMSTGSRDGYRPEPPRDVTTTTPTSLAAWCYEVLRPALGG